jgi:hypothetical protein
MRERNSRGVAARVVSHIPGCPRKFYVSDTVLFSRKSAAYLPRAPRISTLVLVLFWCAVLVVVVAIKLGPGVQPTVTNDGTQYLSVAGNFRHGLGLRTSLVYFDAERSSGVIPAPLTTWPVGYPIAVATVEAMGLSGELAGALVSAAAVLGSLVLLAIMSRKIGVPLFGQTVLLGLFALNWWTDLIFFNVGSDAAFTFTVLAAMMLLMTTLEAAETGQRWVGSAAAAGILLGLAYWIRYAGLFVFVGVCASGGLLLVLQRLRDLRPLLLTCSIAAAAIGAEMLRNVILVGNWAGANNKVVHRPVSEVTREMALSIRDVLAGGGKMSHLLVIRVIVMLSLVAAYVVGLAVRRRRSTPTTPDRDSIGSSELLLGVVIATYVACLGYAATRMFIEAEGRYLVPVLPLALLLLAKTAFGTGEPGHTHAFRSARTSFWIVLLGIYAFVHFNAWMDAKLFDPVEAARRALDSSPTGDRNARDIILAAAGRDGTIMATNGQAMGYVLDRPTVALADPVYSSHEWDETFLHSTVKRFSVRVVIVDRSPFIPPVSPFVTGLASGSAPSWLTKLVATELLTAYRPTDVP